MRQPTIPAKSRCFADGLPLRGEAFQRQGTCIRAPRRITRTTIILRSIRRRGAYAFTLELAAELLDVVPKGHFKSAPFPYIALSGNVAGEPCEAVSVKAAPSAQDSDVESTPQGLYRIGPAGAPGGQQTRCRGDEGHHHECRPKRHRVAWAHVVEQVPEQARQS